MSSIFSLNSTNEGKNIKEKEVIISNKIQIIDYPSKTHSNLEDKNRNKHNKIRKINKINKIKTIATKKTKDDEIFTNNIKNPINSISKIAKITHKTNDIQEINDFMENRYILPKRVRKSKPFSVDISNYESDQLKNTSKDEISEYNKNNGIPFNRYLFTNYKNSGKNQKTKFKCSYIDNLGKMRSEEISRIKQRTGEEVNKIIKNTMKFSHTNGKCPDLSLIHKKENKKLNLKMKSNYITMNYSKIDNFISLKRKKFEFEKIRKINEIKKKNNKNNKKSKKNKNNISSRNTSYIINQSIPSLINHLNKRSIIRTKNFETLKYPSFNSTGSNLINNYTIKNTKVSSFYNYPFTDLSLKKTSRKKSSCRDNNKRFNYSSFFYHIKKFIPKIKTVSFSKGSDKKYNNLRLRNIKKTILKSNPFKEYVTNTDFRKKSPITYIRFPM